MITAAEFVRRWNEEQSRQPYDELRPFTASALANVDVPLDAKQFLIEAGLPRSASPFTGFGHPPTFDANSPLLDLTTQWELDDSFRIYRDIGGTSSGDAVCLEEPTGRVVYVNHDIHYQVVLVNTSVHHLAECLLVYRDYATKVQSEAGKDALLRNAVPAHLRAWLQAALLRIDPAVIQFPSFWRENY